MKNVYVYGGSFNELLNLINYLICNKIVPYNIKDYKYIPVLLEQVIDINISSNESVIKQINNKIGSDVFNTIFYIFLSNHEYKEIIIFHFIINSIKYKNKIFHMRNIKSVNEGLKISKYVSRENHKFKGFLRFVELKNKVLYAEFSPSNNIIFLLSKHFKKRLSNEYWVIKDVGRNIISIYNKKDFYILDGDNFKLTVNDKSDLEEDIENMWKEFYKVIGIKERKNDRCRMNFMPKKYWKYITEVKDL